MPESEGYEAAVEAAKEEGYLERAQETPPEVEVIASSITHHREDWLSDPGHEKENSFLVDLTEPAHHLSSLGIGGAGDLKEKTLNSSTRFIFGLGSSKVKDFNGDTVLMTPGFSLKQYRLALESARDSLDASGKLVKVLDYRDDAGISTDRQKLDLPRQFIIIMNREDHDREQKAVSPTQPTTSTRAEVDFARPKDVEQFKKQEGEKQAERPAWVQELPESNEPVDSAGVSEKFGSKTYVKISPKHQGIVVGSTPETIANTAAVTLKNGRVPEFSVALLIGPNKDGDDVLPQVPSKYADRITLEYQTTANGTGKPFSLKFDRSGRLSASDSERLNDDLDPTRLSFRIHDQTNPYTLRFSKIDYGENGRIRGFEFQGIAEAKT